MFAREVAGISYEDQGEERIPCQASTYRMCNKRLYAKTRCLLGFVCHSGQTDHSCGAAAACCRNLVTQYETETMDGITLYLRFTDAVTGKQYITMPLSAVKHFEFTWLRISRGSALQILILHPGPIF